MVMPRSKDGNTLATAGAEMEQGRRSSRRRRLNFWTVPVAAHLRRKANCVSLGRRTAPRAAPERPARSCAARGFARRPCRTGGVGAPGRGVSAILCAGLVRRSCREEPAFKDDGGGIRAIAAGQPRNARPRLPNPSRKRGVKNPPEPPRKPTAAWIKPCLSGWLTFRFPI